MRTLVPVFVFVRVFVWARARLYAYTAGACVGTRMHVCVSACVRTCDLRVCVHGLRSPSTGGSSRFIFFPEAFSFSANSTTSTYLPIEENAKSGKQLSVGYKSRQASNPRSHHVYTCRDVLLCCGLVPA